MCRRAEGSPKEEGKGAFNDEVMSNGVASACALAVKTLAKAEATIKSGR